MRRNAFKVDFESNGVSIHASVKDATFSPIITFYFTKVSIHASVKDATFGHRALLPFKFCFNPRICKRCDYRNPLKYDLSFVSIHASVKDATRVCYIEIFDSL